MAKKPTTPGANRAKPKSHSGAVGGPSTARGVDYQLDYAVYHGLALIAEQLALPYENFTITLEPRQLDDNRETRSDIRITSTRTSAELKLHPTRDDILEWIKLVAADDPTEKHDFVYATASGGLLTSLAALLRLAKEAGNNTEHLQRLAIHEDIKDRDLLFSYLGTDGPPAFRPSR